MKILEQPQHPTAKIEMRQLQNCLFSAIYSILGSIFLGLMSQLSIPLPFTPVPITMQLFAIMLLIIAQGKHKATTSVILYLGQASLGFPVLAGGCADPLWFAGPTAGYLIGFAACAWVAGDLLDRKKTAGFLWTSFSLAAGLSLLYALGTAYLSIYVGWDNAFSLGILPFLCIDIIKLLTAASAQKPILWVGGRCIEWLDKLKKSF